MLNSQCSMDPRQIINSPFCHERANERLHRGACLITANKHIGVLPGPITPSLQHSTRSPWDDLSRDDLNAPCLPVHGASDTQNRSCLPAPNGSHDENPSVFTASDAPNGRLTADLTAQTCKIPRFYRAPNYLTAQLGVYVTPSLSSSSSSSSSASSSPKPPIIRC